ILVRPTVNMALTSGLTAAELGSIGPAVILANTGEVGDSTNNLIYKRGELKRFFTAHFHQLQSDGVAVLITDGTCCFDDCCNTICFTVYNGMDEETGEPIYVRVNFYNDGTGFSSSDGISTLTKVGDDWVAVIKDMDTWTAPADEKGCVPLSVDAWTQTG